MSSFYVFQSQNFSYWKVTSFTDKTYIAKGAKLFSKWITNSSSWWRNKYNLVLRVEKHIWMDLWRHLRTIPLFGNGKFLSGHGQFGFVPATLWNHSLKRHLKRAHAASNGKKKVRVVSSQIFIESKSLPSLLYKEEVNQIVYTNVSRTTFEGPPILSFTKL